MIKTFRVLSAVSVLWLSTGCGGTGDTPELGEVSGTVTLDGEPVEGAFVSFVPEGGRPSDGKTDANGYYELIYSRDTMGAMVGTHTVRILTGQAANDDGTGGAEEKIPAKYNEETELTKEVKPGSQTIDFDLKS